MATHLRELGLRLGLAAAGGGAVFLAVASDDLSIRLVAVAMALVFLGPLVLLLLTDLGMRLGRADHRDPGGPPAIGEWVMAVVFDSAFVFMVYAGLVAAPDDSGELLAAGLICAAIGLFLTAQLVHRWWRARR